jgi:ATP-dependent helicase/nuclease subunit A
LLEVPDVGKRPAVHSFEAYAVARLVRDWVDRGFHEPGDFLVLSRVREPLVEYARALKEFGLPVEVTGGAAVNELSEVALLHTVLAAVVEPDNPVALVGALRSELFGVSDTTLYRFRAAGGVFDIYSAGEHNGGDDLLLIDEARQRLKQYARWLAQLQPVAAVERIAGHLGLFARAASGADGRDRAGGLCKAIELMRSASREYWTPADLARYLWSLVDPEAQGGEHHDGAPLYPHAEPAVRVMNLHQAKGLEAPVVFLVDGQGRRRKDVGLHVNRGSGVVRGYLQLRAESKGRFGRGSVLAVPQDWEAKTQEEQQFQDAEEDRLLYVAATRAGKRLIISSPAKQPRWEKLIAQVPDGDVIPAIPKVTPPVQATRTLAADAPDQFAESIGQRWSASCAPTYDIRQVKTLTVTGPTPVAHPGEHGTEWGTVLHVLLEAAMARPGGDIAPLASAALEEQGLDPREAPEAVKIVRSVMDSDLWRRAQAGKPCMTEVPIQFLQSDARPVIVRGVIDLVFRESAGWVIVDYKTDDREGQDVEQLVEQLVEHYAEQVRLYAEAWAEITGEPVVETGLYFVRTGRYRVVADVPAVP